MKHFTAALFLLLLLPISQGCKKYTPVTGPSNVNFTLNLNESANSGLKSNNSSFSTNGIIIIRDGTGNFFALQQSCSYSTCNLTYLASNNVLQCPCHGCIFNYYGSVLSGPATITLKSYYISLDKVNNILTIHS